MAGLKNPQPYSWGDLGRDLWAEASPFSGFGVVAWRDPTPQEAIEQRARRQRLAENSRVPWIVSDIGQLMQFYDDVQDVIAFSRWNRRLLSPARLKACLQKATASGRTARDAFFTCACPLMRENKRNVASEYFKGWGLLGAGAARVLGALGKVSRLAAYPLLAGQISYQLFGVGLKLGPVFGAALEVAFRALDDVGLPFGPEHNKYHQLKAARVLQRAEKGVGAGFKLGLGDGLTAAAGVREAYRHVGEIPVTVLRPGDGPQFGPLIHDAMAKLGLGNPDEVVTLDKFAADAYDVGESLWNLASSLPGNALGYLVNDLLGGATDDALTGVGVDPGTVAPSYDNLQKAMLRKAHQRRCAPDGSCGYAIEDALTFDEWLHENRPGGWSRQADGELVPSPHEALFSI